MKHEPKALKKGKQFHKRIQKEWKKEAEGDVRTEKSITKPTGRKGRIDIHVTSSNELVAVVEVKASDWDVMTPAGVRRNVNRHVRQIWHYIDSQLEKGIDVSPGLIYSQKPKDKERALLVEKICEDNGITVVWKDE